MPDMDIADLLDLEWMEYEGNPLINPPFPSPILADPTFLPPSDTPDGLWHLFAHSIMGIHHFTARDGLAWERQRGVVCRSSLRAFIFAKDSVYALDVREVEGSLYLYFNARDGWLTGREHVGLAVAAP